MDNDSPPWLAMRASTRASASEIVIVIDRAWRTISAERASNGGYTRNGALTQLSDFGVALTLYPHTLILSVRRVLPSLAPSLFGERREKPQRLWDGAVDAPMKGIDRTRITRALLPDIKRAVVLHNAQIEARCR